MKPLSTRDIARQRRRMTNDVGAPTAPTEVAAQPGPSEAALRAFLERAFGWTALNGWHTADCHSVQYPGSYIEPPDPCDCGADRIEPALAALAALAADQRRRLGDLDVSQPA